MKQAVPFAEPLIAWQKAHGRHDLPWQNTCDPYRIWISEIMLQQTQVETVKPYFERWLKRFPNVHDLAAADLDEVLSVWSGLGYYARARNVHVAARRIMSEHAGRFPDDFETIYALSGIGRSTAAAIGVFAFGLSHPILDGNVKRVLTRYFGIHSPLGQADTENKLWSLVQSLLPNHDLTAYIQGQMDLGATVCTRTKPNCSACPLKARCVALASDRVHELPVRIKAKVKPEHQTLWLMITQQDKVLLVRRQANGIWGGLWSLPELMDTRSVNKALLSQYLAVKVQTTSRLRPLTHTFTHFRLLIRPFHIILNPKESTPASEILPSDSNSTYRWVTPSEALGMGIPAPLRQLITSTFDQHPT